MSKYYVKKRVGEFKEVRVDVRNGMAPARP